MEKLRRLSVIAIFISLLMTSFSACQEKTEIAQEESEKGYKLKIGLMMDTLVQERWLRDRDIFVARATELGAEVIVQTANNDSAEQLKQAQYLVNRNVDVLVIVPHDAGEAGEIVNIARSRGIKVVAYDRLIQQSNCDFYISFDNIKVGELMGKAAIRKAPAGNYIIINGSRSDNNAYMFNEGYKNVLKEKIEDGSIKIIDEIWASDWKYEEAFNCVENALARGENIDAVIAGNDTLAGAAVEALAERRLAGKVTVIGHDADLDGCQRVVEGTQEATVYKPIDKIAKTAAELVVQMFDGDMEAADDKIFDGRYTVPYYKIEPILVTKENMLETIIKDNFHRFEEVYLNIPQSQRPVYGQ